MTEAQNTPKSAVLDFFDDRGLQSKIEDSVRKALKSIEWCKGFAEAHHEDFLREGLKMTLDPKAFFVTISPIGFDEWGFGKFSDFVNLVIAPILGEATTKPRIGGTGDAPGYMSAHWSATTDRPHLMFFVGNVIATGCVAEREIVKRVTLKEEETLVEKVTWKCGGEADA